MFPIESFRTTLLKIVEILKSHEIPFHLTGGVTGVVYGEPRLTQDIDIVLQNESTVDQLGPLLTSLENSDFIFDRATVEAAVENKKMFQLFDLVESLKLDMYPREMIAGELTRSATVEVFEHVSLPIVSRVDAAVSKLIWISKGSHKSRRDLRQIYRSAPDADRELIAELANQFQLSSLLEEVLNEVDEIE